MKVEIRDGHHYVDVFPNPEPKRFDSCAYVPSTRFAEEVIDRSLQKKGINLNYWEDKP